MGGSADVAAQCLEDGCPIDMVENLIEELKAESDSLTQRQQALLLLIGKLQTLNAKPEDNRNEIKKIVDAASRSFSKVEGFEFLGEPLGYSLKPTKGNEL